MLAFALLCLGILGYTYAFYPILVVVLARLFPLRVTRDPFWQPSVSICMAAYNARSYLDEKIRSLLEQDWPPGKLEILVYSDGSTDDTEAVVSAWAARTPLVRLLGDSRRRGKPTGLNRMREAARGEVLLLTDARQSFEPQALRALMERLADRRVGCVTGNLVLRGATGGGAYWRYEKIIRRAEARFRSVVGMTGSIAALRKEDLSPLPEDVILDDVWIPMRLRMRGRRILLAEDAVAYDVAFEDDREFGRKVRTLAGNYQLFARMPRLLSPLHNPSWFETVSHKLMRLICPWALLGMLSASALAAFGATATEAARGQAALLLGAQVLFYLGALMGQRGGQICRLARTFVVLNAAAVVGLWRYLSGRQRITW
jgi:poly-beta-1,6-N-acetyl-D-glucosamine synthase